MASLGFNILAMQEDLVGSLLGSKDAQRKRVVLEMLSMFDVLSVQVVFALLELSTQTTDSEYDDKEQSINPIQLIQALDKT